MNTEKNKIIAEFMGWKIQKDPTERFFGSYKSPIGVWHKEIDLAYHHDWNWLMQVIQKIEGLNYFIQIDSIGVVISRENENIIVANNRTKIESVYNACVEFIKWYNEQN